MAQKTPMDKLQSAIDDILQKYGDDVVANSKAVNREMTRKGVAAVKQNSRDMFDSHDSTPYYSTWTSQFETGRYSSQGIIYNKNFRLPHLLENDHALRGGGRYIGRPHIKPVEDMIIQNYERAVIRDLP